MSKLQLEAIPRIAAQNPPPTDATRLMMRDWAEGSTSHTPLAANVTIEPAASFMREWMARLGDAEPRRRRSGPWRVSTA